MFRTLHRIVRRAAGLPSPPPNAVCSFCGQSYKDAAPFVEGNKGALICKRCVDLSSKLIVGEPLPESAKHLATVTDIPARKRFRFSIRDLLWLVVVAALAVGWWLDHKPQRYELIRGVGVDGKGEMLLIDHTTGEARQVDVAPINSWWPVTIP